MSAGAETSQASVECYWNFLKRDLRKTIEKRLWNDDVLNNLSENWKSWE